MTANDIVHGISVAIDAQFGEAYKIYAQPVAQGLQKPCFFVACKGLAYTPVVGARYRCQTQFVVTYYPQTQDAAGLHTTAEDLFTALAYVQLPCGDLVRASGMRYELDGGVLRFFLSYNIFIVVHEEQPQMEAATVQLLAAKQE